LLGDFRLARLNSAVHEKRIAQMTIGVKSRILAVYFAREEKTKTAALRYTMI
jgi:hypothetical protein